MGREIANAGGFLFEAIALTNLCELLDSDWRTGYSRISK